LLDLGEYIYHVVAHKVRPLWSFHAVHHSDKVMDISTTLREHLHSCNLLTEAYDGGEHDENWVY
ncbi:hypothetical protein HAP39_06715, partial [Elizabethkingia miricola]|nr:hypothetical protein [Elizabethkingia miricola]